MKKFNLQNKTANHIFELVYYLQLPAILLYSVAHTNVDFDKNMLLLKNAQFLPDHYETLTQ